MIADSYHSSFLSVPKVPSLNDSKMKGVLIERASRQRKGTYHFSIIADHLLEWQSPIRYLKAWQ